jgi:hypothetical protein
MTTPAVVPLDKIAGVIEQMAQLPQVECPLVHRFTPGMYSRELTVPKGTMGVTQIHLTEHQFVVSKGRILIWSPGGGVHEITAPHHGITKPGTVRMAVALEDTIWTTFHVTTETDVAELEKQLVLGPVEALKALENEGVKCHSLQ